MKSPGIFIMMLPSDETGVENASPLKMIENTLLEDAGDAETLAVRSFDCK